MTVRVKYCGGCNPRYDRASIPAQLLEEYPGITLAGGDGGGLPDLVAVVCGCPSRCASYEALQSRYGCILLAAPEDYGKLAEAVEANLNISDKELEYGLENPLQSAAHHR